MYRPPLYINPETRKIDHDKVQELFLTPKHVEWKVPYPPTLPRRVIAVGLGHYHLLVAARDGGSVESQVYASGLNRDGQLGLGHKEDCHALTHVSYVFGIQSTIPREQVSERSPRAIFKQVKALDGKNIVQFACGNYFSLALSIDGMDLEAFGKTDFGALGLNLVPDNSSYSLPQRVPLPKVSPLITIEAGDSHAMAINAQHEVYTWGNGESYRTGHDQENDVRMMRVLDLKQFCSAPTGQCHVHGVSGGGNHSLFMVQRYK
jgi:alpha-tubulin suppressor-like RCC1 family protein